MPSGHPDFASLAAFPRPNEHGAAAAVEIAVLERVRFTYAQPSAPQQDDHRAKPVSVGTVVDRAHDGDDLLNGRRIRRVLVPLVSRRTAPVIARHRRWRAAMPSRVQQHGFHESSLGWVGVCCYWKRSRSAERSLYESIEW